MKAIYIALTTIIIAFSSCKKTETKTETETSTATSNTYQVTAQVNSTAFNSATMGVSSSGYNGGFGWVYIISATTDVSNSQKPRIQFTFQPSHLTTGVKSISKNTSDLKATFSENGATFTGVNGSMNVTAIDTANKKIKKLVGTFSFQTDTISSNSKNVTSGNVNVDL